MSSNRTVDVLSIIYVFVNTIENEINKLTTSELISMEEIINQWTMDSESCIVDKDDTS